MSWRSVLVGLHRDLGFFGLGLTLVYALSGLATNHRAHWDYNYATRSEVREVGSPAALLGVDDPSSPAELARARQADLVAALGPATGHEGVPVNAFWRGADRLSVFWDQGERDVVDYAPSTGRAECTRKTPRPVLRTLNMLHMNEKRQVWTWVGDTYALLLLFLGVSGVLVVRGRKGLAGRGGMLVVAGILLPALLVVLFG